MQAYLLEAGIKANIVNVEIANWFTMFRTTDYMAYLGGAASTPLRFALAYMDARTNNFGGPRVVTDEMAAFLDVAQTTFDDNERATAILGLQKYAMEHNMLQGVASTLHYNLRSNKITNIKTETSGYILNYYVKPAA